MYFLFYFVVQEEKEKKKIKQTAVFVCPSSINHTFITELGNDVVNKMCWFIQQKIENCSLKTVSTVDAFVSHQSCPTLCYHLTFLIYFWQPIIIINFSFFFVRFTRMLFRQVHQNRFEVFLSRAFIFIYYFFHLLFSLAGRF